MKHEEKLEYRSTPSTEGIAGNAEDCFEMINKYGTYNIQPTADADNTFPAIAQGLPRLKKPQTRRKK